MSQSNPPQGVSVQQANLQIKGGAAIMAPVSAFQGALPQNALVLVPLSKPTDELKEKLEEGPVVISPEQMWKLMGFNGPAVTVQDNQGRPITIGLEDLLAGLEKSYNENKEDLNRGRLYAQELMKYGRHEQAAGVLAKVVALGGTGEDWLGLGVAQVGAEQWDKAESTLKGAQNLLADNPFPSLHLAKVYKGKEDKEAELQNVERAITIDATCVDAWAYLYMLVKDRENEEAAVKKVSELADAEPNKKSAAPFVAIHGLLAAKEETQDKAFEWAKKAVDRNPDDPLALIALSSQFGRKGDLQAIIALLSQHESKMVRDVRLANNYFEALFQAKEIDKVTKLLNALAGSPNQQVKQFAIERSRLVAQFLQSQQQKVAGAVSTARK